LSSVDTLTVAVMTRSGVPAGTVTGTCKPLLITASAVSLGTRTSANTEARHHGIPGDDGAVLHEPGCAAATGLKGAVAACKPAESSDFNNP
jgi:hypothetical protein